MISQTTKMEINVRYDNRYLLNINNLNSFMVNNSIPAIVVDPQYIDIMLLERAKVFGQYKIITTVDFKEGKTFAAEKLKFLPKTAFDGDGIEILLTPDMTEIACLNELKSITEFARYINPLLEFRWVLGLRTRSKDSIKNFMKYFKDFPGAFIRNDCNCHAPNVDLKVLQEDIKFIKENTGKDIKISGNITLDVMEALKNDVSRFDVTISQAKNIISIVEARDRQLDALLVRGASAEAPKAETKPR